MIDLGELTKLVMKKAEPVLYNFDNIELKMQGNDKVALTYERNGFSHLYVLVIKNGGCLTLNDIAEDLSLQMLGAWDG